MHAAKKSLSRRDNSSKYNCLEIYFYLTLSTLFIMLSILPGACVRACVRACVCVCVIMQLTHLFEVNNRISQPKTVNSTQAEVDITFGR